MKNSSDFALPEIPLDLRGLYFQWMSQAKDGQLPKLNAFDLSGLSESSHSLILTEIIRYPDGTVEDFEPVFIGSTLRDLTREKMPGRRLSSFPGKGPGSDIWSLYLKMADSRKPLLASLPYVGPSPLYQSTKEILLPLSGPNSGDRAQYVLADVLLSAEPI
ncbi:hypothetical protein [Primorskyibacter sp. 2E233]|uniref:hypothetical protein n=1 Tax=Primorskyibacter sp. 2E233 TaxID=3413431 RepID=UPI003BF4246F